MGTGNLKYDIRKSKANHFSKKEASFYKLSNKQIAHLIDYLVNDFNQEELNSAIGYTCNCPYCSSRNIYKIESNSNLYKFKCETCNKKFTNLSKSVISDLLKQEYIKKYNRFTYKNTLKDIEVWFCFDVEHEWRRFNILERKNFVSTNFRWRHNIIQIPKELRNNKLTNIYECDEKGFLNLVNSKINKTLIKKKKSNTRFIVLTFLEGKYVSSQSVDFTNKQFMKIDNLTLNSYKNEVQKKKAYQKYISLQECLMQSYNKSCETLKKPNREDKVYKDIETPYKHTYILAYEMAIRNSDVKRILYILQYLRDIQQKLLLINNQYSKEQNSSIAIACKAKKNYDENINHVREELLSKYPNYMNSNLHKEYLSIGYKLLTDLINDFEERLQKNYLIIPKKNKIITPEANRIKMQRVIHNSIDPKNYSWSTSKQAEEKYKFEETVYDEYVNSMGVFQGDDQFDVNVIRPTFNLHLIDNNYSYIPVNLTLPIEEITAFIEKIKADLQSNENIVKSPLELLGEELDVIDGADAEQHLDKSFKGKLTSMADALFAFDMFQYLSEKQNTLIQRRDLLQQELNNKLSNHIRPGRRTKLQKVNIKKITKEYESELLELNSKISDLAETVDARYEIIKKSVKACNTTIVRYLSLMNQYIEEKKYKKLFLKTKNN